MEMCQDSPQCRNKTARNFDSYCFIGSFVLQESSRGILTPSACGRTCECAMDAQSAAEDNEFNRNREIKNKDSSVSTVWNILISMFFVDDARTANPLRIRRFRVETFPNNTCTHTRASFNNSGNLWWRSIVRFKCRSAKCLLGIISHSSMLSFLLLSSSIDRIRTDAERTENFWPENLINRFKWVQCLLRDRTIHSGGPRTGKTFVVMRITMNNWLSERQI